MESNKENALNVIFKACDADITKNIGRRILVIGVLISLHKRYGGWHEP